MEQEFQIPVDAGFDTPISLDWEYKDVVPEDYGASINVDRETLMNRIIAFNQYRNPKTRNGCGWYGLTHTENAMRILEHLERGTENQTDPAGRWIDWNENDRPAPSRWNGTSLQGNLNIFRNRGWIAGYAYANSIAEAKRAIDNGHLIYTGTNMCNWRETYRTKIFTPSESPVGGHLFMGAGAYNDKGLRAIDSNGPEIGEFLIPREHLRFLYSRAAIIPISNADLIANYRTMSQFDKEFETAIKKGITNGEREQDAATRKEASVMTLRATEKMKQDILTEVNTLIEQKFNVIAEMIQKLKQ